jgi:hypothetical protein
VTAGTSDVTTKAPDATARTKTTDVTAAKAPNATAEATDVTAAKASAMPAETPAASSAATATAAATTGIGSDGEKGNGEEQHRGNTDAGLQHRSRISASGQFRSCHRRLNRERMSGFPQTESF